MFKCLLFKEGYDWLSGWYTANHGLPFSDTWPTINQSQACKTTKAYIYTLECLFSFVKIIPGFSWMLNNAAKWADIMQIYFVIIWEIRNVILWWMLFFNIGGNLERDRFGRKQVWDISVEYFDFFFSNNRSNLVRSGESHWCRGYTISFIRTLLKQNQKLILMIEENRNRIKLICWLVSTYFASYNGNYTPI